MKNKDIWRISYLTVASCLLMTLVLCSSTLTAQIQQPYRYEHEQKNSDDYFHIINLKEKGLALFRERDKFKNSNRIWDLTFVDSTLREKVTLELEIKERYKMIGYEVAPQSLYFLFRTGERNKNELLIIDVGFDGREQVRHLVKPDLDFRLTHFVKAGNNFVFGGYVNNEAVIVIFEPAANSLKVVPGFFQKDTELVDVRTNQNQTFNTVLIDRTNKGERKLVFRTFDEGGKQLLEDVVLIEEDISLLTGITSSLEREELMVAGTWGDRNAKQSHGFYTLPVNPFADQKIQYVDFGKLNHFVEFLNDKRATRIKESTKEANAAGKRSSFTSYVMPFKIIENNKGFFLLAEVYSPNHTSSMQNANPYYYNPYSYSPYGYYPYFPAGFYYPGMSRMYRPYMYGPDNNKNDEVKSLATVVLSFDPEGNIKWDQSLKMEDIRLPGLEQVSDFVIKDNKVCLIYKKESELKVKTIVLDNDEVSETSEKLKTTDEEDIIRSEKESETGVRHWFGNSFYVWGYHTIRNTGKEDRVRDVFYINRVDAK